MRDGRSEDFVRRQAQWDAFHHWEAEREILPISFEDRIHWYAAAFKLAHAAITPKDIDAKVEYILKVRQLLAHLK